MNVTGDLSLTIDLFHAILIRKQRGEVQKFTRYNIIILKYKDVTKNLSLTLQFYIKRLTKALTKSIFWHNH